MPNLVLQMFHCSLLPHWLIWIHHWKLHNWHYRPLELLQLELKCFDFVLKSQFLPPFTFDLTIQDRFFSIIWRWWCDNWLRNCLWAIYMNPPITRIGDGETSAVLSTTPPDLESTWIFLNFFFLGVLSLTSFQNTHSVIKIIFLQIIYCFKLNKTPLIRIIFEFKVYEIDNILCCWTVNLIEQCTFNFPTKIPFSSVVSNFVRFSSGM